MNIEADNDDADDSNDADDSDDADDSEESGQVFVDTIETESEGNSTDDDILNVSTVDSLNEENE